MSQAQLLPDVGLMHPVFFVQSTSLVIAVFVHVVSAGVGGVTVSSTHLPPSYLQPTAAPQKV